MTWKQWILTLTLATVTPTCGNSSAWKPNSGNFCAAPYLLYYKTEHFWDRDGKRQPNYNRFERTEGGLILQYGVTARDSVTLWGAYDIIDEKLDGNSYGFTDMEVNWKHQLSSQGTHAIAASLTSIIPTDNGYKPAVRYGQWGFQGTLHDTFSLRLCHLPLQLDNSLGYRWYQGYPSDQLRHRLLLSLSMRSWLSLRFGSAIDFGLFNGKSRFNQSLVWLNPNYRLWKGDVAITLEMGRYCHCTIGYFQHLLGQNIGTSGGAHAALAVAF